MNQETRVGIFVIGAILIIGWASLFLGDVKLTRRYNVHVLFDNSGGLPVKGAVKSAGVTIGRVEDIELQGGRALVTAEIKSRYPIHTDATARIASTGFIGSKFLEINPGSSGAPLLEDGGTIEGKPSISFDDWMEKLSALFKKDEKYGDPIENIKATLANMKDATETLGQTLKENRTGLDSIIKNTQKLVKNLEDITSSSKENIKIALGNFRKITERAEALLKQVQEGKGAVGTLVSDEQTGQNVKETVASLRETAKDAEAVLGRLRRIQIYWDYRQRYDFGDSRFRSDFGVKFVPRPGKFYSLRVNNIGDQKDRNLPGVDFERKNTITAVLGNEFGPLTLYVGVIRAQGGLGGAFRPFWNNSSWAKRLEVRGEVYDFARDETLQGTRYNKPVYSAGGRIGIFRWLYAGAQVEDIATRANVVGNINVELRDDDISYLFGLASLAGPAK